jgi:ribosomal protein L11 methyltransferase
MTRKQYVHYVIEALNAERQEVLIADLEEYGFMGYEQTGTSFTADAVKGEVDEVAVETFLTNQHVHFTKQYIQEENWNEQWEQSFEPIVVADFCAVRAHFHKPIDNVQHNVIITPKMSFGTGHHATTYMMIQAMQQLNLNGKQVLDFGTGTGILAILAEKMGAQQVEAIDYDDWCIENGTENVVANQCHRINLRKADNVQDAHQADVILANINKNVILENMSALKAKLAATGSVLLSGLLQTDEVEVNAAALKYDLHQRRIIHRDGWICILFTPSTDEL